jgi:hypothetical protein
MSSIEPLEQGEGKTEPESARRNFEQHSALSMELLTNKNEAILLTGQFYMFQQNPGYTSSFMNWIQPNEH